MEGRRWRRQTRRVGSQTLLPLRSTPLTNTLSCWYCDLKMTRFNQPLYHFGQKHARFLRVWFTVGTGFSLSLLFAVTMILIWESVTTLCLFCKSDRLTEVFESLLVGINPSSFGSRMSFGDVGYLVVSTLISVAVHEFGHAVAAASEGIHLEYVAIFLAVLFPGALVAFNHEVLQAKPSPSALRIYCAGVWHNAVCCAACGLALLVLPLVLSPLYLHDNSPMVLDVSARSPLSNYLSPGDVILSVDGTKIHKARDWIDMAISLKKPSLESSEFEDNKGYLTIERRTYCAPTSLVENSKKLFSVSNLSACSNEQIAFVPVPCYGSSSQSVGNGVIVAHEANHIGYCLSSADVVNLTSCESLETISHPEGSCLCSENELCLSPVQMPGIVWAEITYRSPYYNQCNSTAVEGSDSGDIKCHKTFLYVGDVIFMAHSVRLTSYKPRFTFPVGALVPDSLEKILVWTFQVSVALALFNSLPVYCLDGESILEVSSLYVAILSPRSRRLLLQACLFVGSILSGLTLLRTLLIKFC